MTARTTAPRHAPALYLGIDGGGTKTSAVVVDAQGTVRGRGSATSANQASVGPEAAVRAVVEAAEAALHVARADVPGARCAAARIGLAGVHTPRDVEALAPRFVALAPAIHLTNDAELVLEALPGGVGVALIAGTGSIALGRDASGATARSGGWGHIFGDEGSGYRIGSEALRAIARAADGRGRPTALTKAILGAWGLSEPGELIAEVYQESDKARIAALAALVLAAAEAGDRAAHAILRREAEALAAQGLAVANTLHLPRAGEPLPVALGGGLLLGSPAYRALVLGALERRRACRPVALAEEPALAAARAAATCATTTRPPTAKEPNA